MKTKELKTILAALGVVTTLNISAQDKDTTKHAFKPSGKIWGYAFGDYYSAMSVAYLTKRRGDSSAAHPIT